VKRTLFVVSVVGVCALSSFDASAKVTVVNSSPRVATTATATRGPVADSASRETWVGTRAIVRDASGKLRKPTATETRDMVKSIRQLTARPAMRTESTSSRGGVIEAAPQQVVIARATEEGTMETLCVQSFEEAANFLGLVKQSDSTSQQ
jgi:hypothetical protein